MGASTYQWLLDNSKEWTYKVPCLVFTHRNLKTMSGADV